MCKNIFKLVPFIKIVNAHCFSSIKLFIHLKNNCITWWCAAFLSLLPTTTMSTSVSSYDGCQIFLTIIVYPPNDGYFCSKNSALPARPIHILPFMVDCQFWYVNQWKVPTKASSSPNQADHKNEKQWVYWANDLCGGMVTKIHLHSLQSHLSHFQSWWSWCNIKTMIEIMWFLAQ
jgi:hypothetical protein